MLDVPYCLQTTYDGVFYNSTAAGNSGNRCPGIFSLFPSLNKFLCKMYLFLSLHVSMFELEVKSRLLFLSEQTVQYVTASSSSSVMKPRVCIKMGFIKFNLISVFWKQANRLKAERGIRWNNLNVQRNVVSVVCSEEIIRKKTPSNPISILFVVVVFSWSLTCFCF